jgi:hypothetical protein
VVLRRCDRNIRAATYARLAVTIPLKEVRMRGYGEREERTPSALARQLDEAFAGCELWTVVRKRGSTGASRGEDPAGTLPGPLAVAEAEHARLTADASGASAR